MVGSAARVDVIVGQLIEDQPAVQLPLRNSQHLPRLHPPKSASANGQVSPRRTPEVSRADGRRMGKQTSRERPRETRCDERNGGLVKGIPSHTRNGARHRFMQGRLGPSVPQYSACLPRMPLTDTSGSVAGAGWATTHSYLAL